MNFNYEDYDPAKLGFKSKIKDDSFEKINEMGVKQTINYSKLFWTYNYGTLEAPKIAPLMYTGPAHSFKNVTFFDGKPTTFIVYDNEDPAQVDYINFRNRLRRDQGLLLKQRADDMQPGWDFDPENESFLNTVYPPKIKIPEGKFQYVEGMKLEGFTGKKNHEKGIYKIGEEVVTSSFTMPDPEGKKPNGIKFEWETLRQPGVQIIGVPLIEDQCAFSNKQGKAYAQIFLKSVVVLKIEEVDYNPQAEFLATQNEAIRSDPELGSSFAAQLLLMQQMMAESSNAQEVSINVALDNEKLAASLAAGNAVMSTVPVQQQAMTTPTIPVQQPQVPVQQPQMTTPTMPVQQQAMTTPTMPVQQPQVPVEQQVMTTPTMPVEQPVQATLAHQVPARQPVMTTPTMPVVNLGQGTILS